jgi:hypothetical protein
MQDQSGMRGVSDESEITCGVTEKKNRQETPTSRLQVRVEPVMHAYTRRSNNSPENRLREKRQQNSER